MNKRIGEASRRLPKRQREALELREREGLSYEAIAARVGTSPGSVAQLISRARINLYDELRGTPLASIAAPSPQCERALPLIAAREDEQLEAVPGGDADWLDAHLADCERCRPGVEQMAQAAASYRGSTAAAGADEGGPGAQLPATSDRAPSLQSSLPRAAKPRWRAAALAAAGAFLVLGGIAAAFVGSDGAEAPSDPAEAAAPAAAGVDAPSDGGVIQPAKVAKGDRGRKAKPNKKPQPAGEGARGEPGSSGGEAAPTTVVAATPPPAGGAGTPKKATSAPDRSSGKAAVDAPQQISGPKASAKPQPAATSTPPPQSAPAPTPEPTEVPPGEEPPDAPGRSGEAPGKPPNRPPR
jgi:hypothetical protein